MVEGTKRGQRGTRAATQFDEDQLMDGEDGLKSEIKFQDYS